MFVSEPIVHPVALFRRILSFQNYVNMIMESGSKLDAKKKWEQKPLSRCAPIFPMPEPRGQRRVLGLKRDIDKERVTYFNGQTDLRTYPVIEMQGRQLNISNESRYIFCAVRVSFLHFSRKRYGRTDRRTDGRTDGPTDRRTCPLIEMRGRI